MFCFFRFHGSVTLSGMWSVPCLMASVTALLVAVGGFTASAAVLTDNFDDNVIGPLWQTVIDNPATLNLVEQNERVDLLANGPTSAHTDALYLSTFRLSTASNFEITLDYRAAVPSWSGASFGDIAGIVFGVGTDREGDQSAAMIYGYGYAGVGAIPASGVGYRLGSATDIQGNGIIPDLVNQGTFTIHYDSASDTLTFLRAGVEVDALENIVRGNWGATDLLVSFGARGKGAVTSAGDWWVDNFTIVSGVLVPEPTSAALLIGATCLLGRRRRV